MRSMYFYPNRLLCSVLEEMRKANETRNYSYLPGLIEEVQMLANRMEAGLADQKDLRRLTESLSEKKKELGELEVELKRLRELTGKKEAKNNDDY